MIDFNHKQLLDKSIKDIYHELVLIDDNQFNIKHFRIHMCLEYFFMFKCHDEIAEVIKYYDQLLCTQDVDDSYTPQYSIAHNIVGVCHKYGYDMKLIPNSLFLVLLKSHQLFNTPFNANEYIQCHYSLQSSTIEETYSDICTVSKVIKLMPVYLQDLVKFSKTQWSCENFVNFQLEFKKATYTQLFNDNEISCNIYSLIYKCSRLLERLFKQIPNNYFSV